MAEADYYRVLGVPPSATSKQIKSAYRRLVKKYHPDLFATPDEKARATAVFHRINHAYAVLGDPKRRSFYDQLRAQKPVDAEPHPAAQPGSRSAKRKKMAVGRPMLLWRAIRQNIAKLHTRAGNVAALKRMAPRAARSVNRLCNTVSRKVSRTPSRWKAAFILGAVVIVWLLVSLWKEPGATTSWALLENTVVEPLRPIAPTFHEPNWTLLAYYPSRSQCAADLNQRIKADERQGAKAFFDPSEATIAITLHIKDEVVLAEEYFNARLRRSDAERLDPELLREQARREAIEFVTQHGITQQVRKLQCREVAQPEREFWLWRIVKQAGLST